MKVIINALNNNYAPVKVSDSFNGMVVFIDQGQHKVALSIDQAESLGAELLRHVEVMAKKHLNHDES